MNESSPVIRGRMTTWLTTNEACEHLHVSRSTLYQLRRAGLPSYLLRGTYRYDMQEVDKWLRQHRQAAPLRLHRRRWPIEKVNHATR